MLRASQKVQEQFEDLLAKRKAGALTPGEAKEYKAICELDDTLTRLNRRTPLGS